MPALWDKLSYTMLTTKVNMHRLVWAPQFFCAIFHSWSMQLSYTLLQITISFHLRLQRQFSRLRNEKDGTRWNSNFVPSSLSLYAVLGHALLPTSPVRFFYPVLHSRNPSGEILPSLTKGKWELCLEHILTTPSTNEKFSFPSKITSRHLFHDFKVFRNLILLTS